MLRTITGVYRIVVGIIVARLLQAQDLRNTPLPSAYVRTISWVLGAADWLFVIFRSVFAVVFALGTRFSFFSSKTSGGGSSRRRKPRPLFFLDGWGDVDRLTAFVASYKDACHDEPAVSTAELPYSASHLRDACREHRVFDLAEAKISSKNRAAMHLAAGALSSNPLPLNVDIYSFEFESPLAPLLVPTEAGSSAKSSSSSTSGLATASYQLVWPRGHQMLPCFRPTASAFGTSSSTPTSRRGPAHEPPVRGVVLLTPATGEQGTLERLCLAARYAAAHQYATIIPIAPFYGSRKPASQPLHYVRSVSDMMLQSLAIASEASTVLLNVLRASTPERMRFSDGKVPVVVSGFSWGGAMTIISAAHTVGFAMPSDVDELSRLGVTPYIGADSPSVYAEGILAADMDWEALIEEARGSQAPTVVRKALAGQSGSAVTRKAVHDALVSILRSMDSKLVVANILPERLKSIRAVHSIVTADDHFVPWPLGRALHDDALNMLHPQGSRRLDVLGGGHVLAFLTKSARLSDAVPRTGDAVVRSLARSPQMGGAADPSTRDGECP